MKWALFLATLVAAQAFPVEVRTDFFGESAFAPATGVASAPADPPSAIAIDALPYDRTVACGSYTLTGTSAGADVVTWSVSPGSASGSCSGTDTWSCVVAVSPTSAATATPTVTVTASTSGGSLTDTVSLGFFPGSAYSCYLAQNVDGSYNSTLANNDAVATWKDSTSTRDLTQGTGASQPSFRDEVVAGFGQPLVSCDGSDDFIAAATAADWTFLHNGSPRTVIVGQATQTSTPSINGTIAGNKTNTDAPIGWRLLSMDSGINDSARQQVGNGSAGILTTNLGADTVKSGWLNALTDVLDDDTGNDGFLYANDTSSASEAATGAFSSSNGQVLTLCNRAAGGGSTYGGYLSHLIAYQRVLTSGEIDAAEAVVEWAYGGQPSPVALPTRATRADWGTTLSGSDVTEWAMRGLFLNSQALYDCTVSSSCPLLTGSGTTLGLTFDGSNDFLRTTQPPGFSTTSGHMIVVATIPSAVVSLLAGENVAGSTYGMGAEFVTGNLKPFAWSSGSDGFKIAYGPTISAGRAIFEWRHDSATTGISVAYNGGTFTSVASAARSGVTNFSLSTGTSLSAFYASTIHEVAIFPAALPDDNRTAIINDMKSRWGIP